MSERKYKQFINEKINRSDQSSPFPALFKDVSFGANQEIEISEDLFFAGNLLLESWLKSEEETFCIAEVGFGFGLDFLFICQLFKKFLHENPTKPLKKLFYTSFEKAPLTNKNLQLALQSWLHFKDIITPLLKQYPLAISGCHRLHFSSITLDLWFGDIDDSLSDLHIYESGLFNYWHVEKLASLNRSLFPIMVQSSKANAIISCLGDIVPIEHELQTFGYSLQKHSCNANKNTILIFQLQLRPPMDVLTNNELRYIPSKTSSSKDVAIIGGGISSACLSLALINRGYHVTLYCKDEQLGLGASGNQQGALYPLLNGQHDNLSQLFANSFLYARNYVELINNTHPFDYDLSGLLQLYYDQKSSLKLDKILKGNFPKNLVEKVEPSQTDMLANLDIGQSALFYPLAGWLSPKQMVQSIFKKAQQSNLLTIKMNHQLLNFEKKAPGWQCKFEQMEINHSLLILTTAMNTLHFKQCKALPLSAARGQVTHIETNSALQKLKMTLCHEGYLTPLNQGTHCMGATFKRHCLETGFNAQEQIDNKMKLDRCIQNKGWVEKIETDHQQANVGVRCTTRDHFPYMGGMSHYQQTKDLFKDSNKNRLTKRIPYHNNLFILTGLGSRGLTTAPLLAEALASQINQEPIPMGMTILNSMQCHRQWVNYLIKGKKLKF